MKQLNHCSACYDPDTLVSYSTLIYKRTEHYTFVFRYHSTTTTQHWYKFCDKVGIGTAEARKLWNYKAKTHSVYVIANCPAEPDRLYYHGTDCMKDRANFLYPEEVPSLGYGIIDL